MAIQRVLTFDMGSTSNSGPNYSGVNADRLFASVSSGTQLELRREQNEPSLFIANTNAYAPNYIFASSSSGFATYNGLSSNTVATVSWSLTANNRLVLGCYAYAIFGFGVTEIGGFSGASTTRITFGLNGRFLAIYVDGSAVATSTYDLIENGFTYVELFVDKSVPRVYLLADGIQVADAAISGSVVLNSISFYPTTTANGYTVDHAIVLDNELPRGPMFLEGRVPAAVVAGSSQFSGTLGTVQTRPFVNATFRESTTANAVDLYTYANITTAKPTSCQVKFVRQQVVASSSGAGGGNLNLRTQVGGVDFDFSVTSQLTSTTPVLCQGPVYFTNPSSGAIWTLTDLQTSGTFRNGYVVKA